MGSVFGGSAIIGVEVINVLCKNCGGDVMAAEMIEQPLGTGVTGVEFDSGFSDEVTGTILAKALLRVVVWSFCVVADACCDDEVNDKAVDKPT